MPLLKLVHTSTVNRGALRAGLTPADGVAFVQAFEDGIVGSGNYKKEWAARQSTWEPLRKEYLEEKTERGFSTQKWVLSGDTMRALSTPAKIFSSVSVAGSTRTITILENVGYFVVVGWNVGAPAASGWPGEKHGISHFSRNNARRPWIDKVGPEAVELTYLKMSRIVFLFWQRVFPAASKANNP